MCVRDKNFNTDAVLYVEWTSIIIIFIDAGLKEITNLISPLTYMYWYKGRSTRKIEATLAKSKFIFKKINKIYKFT